MKKILTITLDPQEDFLCDYVIEEHSFSTKGLDEDEIAWKISDIVQLPLNGFPRYGIALDTKQAGKVYKALKKFLRK